MLTWELFETKYNQMANPEKSGDLGKLRKTAHSQGYDVSEPKDVRGTGHYTVDLIHRKTGQKVKNTSGGNFGGSAHGKLNDRTPADNTIRNQVSQSIKADRQARGGVDKRPEAKAKRKAEAIANRARKKKQRDPFTREHTEWWVNIFREDMEEKRRIAQQRRDARVAKGGKGAEGATGSHFHQNKSTPKATPKATPKTKTSSALTKTNTPVVQKDGAIVPSKPGAVTKSPTSSITKASKPGAITRTKSKGGAIEKRKSSALGTPGIKKANVKVHDPKYKPKRPGTTRDQVNKPQKSKVKKDLGIGKGLGKAMDVAKKSFRTTTPSEASTSARADTTVQARQWGKS